MVRFLALLALALAALFGARYVTDFSASTAEPSYRLAKIDRGPIVATVNSTGAINPVTTVIVSSQISGQVVEILADFNSEVKANQLVARLNSDQVRAKLDGARADLQQIRAQKLVTQAQIERAGSEILRAKATEADAMAQIARAEALSADAERILGRQIELQSRGYAATATLDTARAQRDSQTRRPCPGASRARRFQGAARDARRRQACRRGTARLRHRADRAARSGGAADRGRSQEHRYPLAGRRRGDPAQYRARPDGRRQPAGADACF